MKNPSLLAVGLVLAAFPGQDPRPAGPATGPSGTAEQAPEARAADVASVESIVAALYDVISGPAGEPRDWRRLRSLCRPDARFVPLNPGADRPVPPPLGVDDYVLLAGPTLIATGFFETEVARRVDRFGNVAHVWSTYEGRRGSADAEPFVRGINSLQLVRGEGRWWVASVAWQAETEAEPIPADYLRSR